MRLLVVEDNKDLCESICYQLKNEGYAVDSCHTGENALYYIRQQSCDIIILDRMLPGMDGLSILKVIRKENINIPVIMVTAMDGLHDRIDGLDTGADDYLVKPFEIEELLARIRALARRPRKMEQNTLRFLDMELYVKQQYILAGEKICPLSKRETELLELFFRNTNQILSREMILAHVWGADNFVEEGNLDIYIHFVRRHLKSVETSVQIKTIHGVGYRLEENKKDR